ncbi:unnamed protein product [Spirodela intermedia]|uniref:3-ketoacyl-CoA synthase n=1 Tax=Spirodela intermedia TaxID=51605 RepID=A0A7I8ILJ3_SPIIN|nr:unnamed protein product [Spirodela intermedia]CAA6658692.1 unnamed protein product [Spirodela intermedia]
MAGEQEMLTTEIVNRGVEAGSPTFSVRVRRRLPDFLQSVNLKYVKLGYHYLINHAVYLATFPVLVLVFSAEASYDLATVLTFFGVLVFTVSVYFLSRPKPIYLMDFACYHLSSSLAYVYPNGGGAQVSKEEFIELARKSGKFDEDSLAFQSRILKSSGIGDETYIPKAVMAPENCATMKEGRAEAAQVVFGALDELFEKCRIRPKDVGILVVNCSLFNPTPSLSAMVVNHYKMRGNILSYNLGGMGCSAGVIALDLARDMLQANPNSYAVVVSTEMVTFNWYTGRTAPSVLLSNRRRDFGWAKYRLEHIVRTHKGSDDRSFRSVHQEEDEQRIKGLSVSRDVMEVGGRALEANITTLGPLVLPFSEQLLFFGALVWRYLFGGTAAKTRPYIPDYKLAFDHFCIHPAGKVVLNELQRNLELSGDNMEASRMTLHRFGNTSSSSIWYELAYLEAKGKIRRGDRVWQLAFGSGFKCNSSVWRAMRRVRRPARNPWLDTIDQYPVPL